MTKGSVDFITLEHGHLNEVYKFKNYEAYVYDKYHGNMKLVTDHLMRDIVMQLASSDMVDDDDLQTYCLDVGPSYYTDDAKWEQHWIPCKS